jgi:glycosyltransferase A (GT-A) superfamily protein (DUF2064 family)
MVATLHAALATRATEPGARRNRLLADAVGGHLALARRDTAAALRAFRALRPTAKVDSLTWDLWEPLAVERLALAKLLLERRQYREAHRVAAEFDHPEPIIYVAFVRASLQIRLLAAEGLGSRELAATYRSRLGLLDRRGPHRPR